MRLLPRLLVLALAVVCGACGSCSKNGSAVVDAATSTEPPVPSPEGLLAEAWLRSPDTAWARLQHGAGGALALLPPTAGQLACALAGLDTDVAPLLDGRAASYAVVAERAPGDLAWAIALPLRDDARAAALLLSGDAGRYSGRVDGALRIVSRIDAPLPVAVALARGWLLLARDEAALLALAPYAYRTMPSKPAPPSNAFAVVEAPPSSLAGPIATALLSQWGLAKGWLAATDEENRARNGGRPPDFGDSRAILEAIDAAVRRRVALVAASQDARLELDIGEDQVRADLSLVPGTGGPSAHPVDAMRPGDALPLARAPASAILALLLRDDASERASGAHDTEAALSTALGDRLKPDDVRAVHDALEDWARARGDWLTAALLWRESRGLWIRTPAADGGVATRAVREVVGLLRRPALGEPIARSLSLGPSTMGAADVAPFGKVAVATFASKAAALDPDAPSLGIAWGVHDGDLSVTAGESASRLLAAQASAAGTLGDDPVVARALADLGSDVVFALVAEPLRLDVARAAAGSAPAVLAVGKRGGALWVRVQVADLLLRELVRLGSGL